MDSWWPTTHLCQVTVALRLKVAASYQTVKRTVSPDMQKPLAKYHWTVLGCPLLPRAVLVPTVSTSHATKHDQCWFLRHWSHLTITFGEYVKSCNTVATFSLLNCQFLQMGSYYHSALFYQSHVSHNVAIVTHAVCVPYSFLQHFCTIFTFLIFQ